MYATVFILFYIIFSGWTRSANLMMCLAWALWICNLATRDLRFVIGSIDIADFMRA